MTDSQTHIWEKYKEKHLETWNLTMPCVTCVTLNIIKARSWQIEVLYNFNCKKGDRPLRVDLAQTIQKFLEL